MFSARTSNQPCMVDQDCSCVGLPLVISVTSKAPIMKVVTPNLEVK